MSRRPPLPSLNSLIPTGMSSSRGTASSSGPPSRQPQQSLNATLPSSQRSNAASAPPPSRPSLHLNELRSTAAEPPRQEQNQNLSSLSRSVAAQAPPSAAPVSFTEQVAKVRMGAEALALMAQEEYNKQKEQDRNASRAASITPIPSQPGARAMGAEDIIRPQVLFPTPSPSSAIQRPPDRVSFHPTTLPEGSITDASKLLSNLEISKKAAIAASSAAQAQVLARDNAVSGAKNTVESIVSTIAARATPSSAAPVQTSSPAPVSSPASALPQPSEVRQQPPPPSSPPLFRPIIPSSLQTFEESPSMMDRASRSRVDYTPFVQTREALFSSPPPSSANQSVLDRISSLEKELEECYKKVVSRESISKKMAQKNELLKQQIKVLEQQLQEARQAQQGVVDDDATSSNSSNASSSTASFRSATSQHSDDEGREGGKRKTKFKKNKKMYNKTSKKYNKTSKKARY